MNSKIDKETEALLASGDINGEALQAEEQYEEGIVAIRKADGKKIFLPKAFVDLARLRNRGRD